MEKQIAIKIDNVKKRYKLGQIGGGTLKADLESWWARKIGKEDPNLKIGVDQRLFGQTFMALNGVDLDIYKGEAVGIIGSNGAGKSTLLKLLSQVTAPTDGDIDIYGRVASMLEVGTGFNGEMTGRENVYLNGAILGMTRSEIDAKMEQIIEFSEVRDFIDTPVKRYSSGMFVKLAFSVAAHLDSEIMIMDEVLAVGDMAFQKKCLNKMREAASQEGRTVLYVSHNMNTIRQLCDRCVVLDKGKKIYDGDVEEAIAIYMGTAGQKDFPAKHDFTKIDRLYHFGKDMKILSMEFLHKEQAVFEIFEDMDIEFTVESKKSFNKACFLLHVRNESYEKIGMSCSDVFSVKEGFQKFRVKFPTNMFTDEKYCLNIELVELDDAGNFFSYDNPGAKVMIKMVGKSAHGIVWNSNYWGNISFPKMKFIE